MRLLLSTTRAPDGAPGTASELDDAALAELYAYPELPVGALAATVRANAVTTLDGSGVGPDGLTGSLETPVDHRVFGLLRSLADVVLVGSGTAVSEGYGRIGPLPGSDRPPAALAVVSARARLPRTLLEPSEGRGPVYLVTCEAANPAALAQARDTLGEDHVLVAGVLGVEARSALEMLVERGLRRVLCEGGPALLSVLLSAGLVDELALTSVPVIVGGPGPRFVRGPALGGRRGMPARPRFLLEEGGALLGLYDLNR